MTEAEWLTATDPQAMLRFLRGSQGASNRKVRLFTLACCRRLWGPDTHEVNRRLVEVAERYADAERSGVLKAEVRRAWQEAGGSNPTLPLGNPWRWAALYSRWLCGVGGEEGAGRAAQAELLREIVGNPFRPPQPLAPAVLAWSGGLVTRLAKAAYDERLPPSGQLDPGRLAVLADALEEAGCDDAGLLGHLRAEGPHWRGCFALDAILGRG